MKKATKDNAPEIPAEGLGIDPFEAMLQALMGPSNADVVTQALATIDRTAPGAVDYRAHLLNTAFGRAHVDGLVPDQLTVLAFRAFAEALEESLKAAGEWVEDYKIPTEYRRGGDTDDKGDDLSI